MNNVLGQYAMGGRLGDSIRERQGMAYYVSSALDAERRRGPLLIRAGVSPANVDRAVASIDEELARLRSRRRHAEGAGRVAAVPDRRRCRARSRPTPASPSFLQTAEFFGLGLDYDLRLPDLLRAVTLDEVNAVARRVLDPARATVVMAGPYEGSGLGRDWGRPF